MKTHTLHIDSTIEYMVAFEKDEEVTKGLLQFALRNNVTAGRFSAIGAFRSVTLGYFDVDKMDYNRITLDEQVEVVSLVGNVALHDDTPKVHPHVVVATSDARAFGGHLLEGIVRPTLEVMFTQFPGELHRETDKEYGIPLLKL